MGMIMRVTDKVILWHVNACDRRGYSVAGGQELMSFNGHKKSCRRVRFNSDGSQLVTASKDKSIQVIDMAAGSVSARIKDAHECVFIHHRVNLPIQYPAC